MTDNEVLFQPLQLGDLHIPHRILMAPLTRARAPGRVPNALMAEYYSQRAGAGLIISEATAISPQGYGWHDAPALYTDEQVAGWANVTKQVHAAGGRIFLQLWHMGRISHPDYHDGKLPVGPSAIAAIGEAHTPTGKKPFVVPHPLTVDEIAEIVADYAAATVRAKQAGFDGVEIHAANSYLIDQFLRDSSNQRQDQYGGSIENRLRFLREVVTAVVAAWSPGRTGVRLSPAMNANGMSDSDPVSLFTAAAAMLNDFHLAYLHVAEAIQPGRLFNPDVPPITPQIRKAYDGLLVANGGYSKTTAAEAIRSVKADAIAFGQLFIANPDLPLRLQHDAPLITPEVSSYYSHGPHGYTDYPSLALTHA